MFNYQVFHCIIEFNEVGKMSRYVLQKRQGASFKSKPGIRSGFNQVYFGGGGRGVRGLHLFPEISIIVLEEGAQMYFYML